VRLSEGQLNNITGVPVGIGIGIGFGFRFRFWDRNSQTPSPSLKGQALIFGICFWVPAPEIKFEELAPGHQRGWKTGESRSRRAVNDFRKEFILVIRHPPE